MPFVYHLSDFGSTFSTRPRGVELRNALIKQACGETIVKIDFSNVLSISYSFADEFAAGLVQGSADGSILFAVDLVGISDEVARVIDRAIANRRLQATQATSHMAFA
jgi:hypothetical protein